MKDSDKPGAHESRTSESRHEIREFRSEVVLMRASAVPPNITRNLEARFESQKYEIQSLPRDLRTTQVSPSRWAEVTLNFKVSVLMKVLRHRHHPSAELRNPQSVVYLKLSDPELFQLREHSLQKAAPTLATALGTPPASISKSPLAVHNSSLPTTSFTCREYRSCRERQSLIWEA